MMTIRFNEDVMLIEKNSSLMTALEKIGLREGSFALALNRHFVPKSQYAHTVLQENDVIDIVIPMQGG